MHLVPAPAVKLLRNLGIEREMSVVVFMKLIISKTKEKDNFKKRSLS